MALRGRVGCPDTLFTKAVDVARRRAAEEARVLVTELGRARIADAPSRGSGVEHRREHQAPRFLQPQSLLVLQGTEAGDGFELP
jgi:hypothetical protein